MAIDYINALGAGASFDEKIVEALVEAKEPLQAMIERKMASADAD